MSYFQQAHASPRHGEVSGTKCTQHSKTEAQELYDAALIPVYIFRRKEENNLQSATWKGLSAKFFQLQWYAYKLLHIYS